MQTPMNRLKKSSTPNTMPAYNYILRFYRPQREKGHVTTSTIPSCVAWLPSKIQIRQWFVTNYPMRMRKGVKSVVVVVVVVIIAKIARCRVQGVSASAMMECGMRIVCMHTRYRQQYHCVHLCGSMLSHIQLQNCNVIYIMSPGYQWCP